MRVDGVCKGIANYINKSKGAQKVLRYFNENSAIANSALAFALAVVARPASILALPMKNEQDRNYSIASSVASGVIELGSSIALFIPLQKAIKKSASNLFDVAGNVFHKNNLALRQYKSVTNRMFKLGALIPISLLRFAIVKPIVNVLFGKKKEVANTSPLKFNTMESFLGKTKKGRLDRWA